MSDVRVTYGFAHAGMDPRDFRPDRDACTPEEIEAWQRAYRAANAGEPWDDPHPPIVVEGETITRYAGSKWGVGTTTWHDAEAQS